MTDNDLPEPLAEALRAHEEFMASVDAFTVNAEKVMGPLGVLLRTIAASHAEFIEAQSVGATTDGEKSRLTQIVLDAMEFEAWLRGGE